MSDTINFFHSLKMFNNNLNIIVFRDILILSLVSDYGIINILYYALCLYLVLMLMFMLKFMRGRNHLDPFFECIKFKNVSVTILFN